jgi:tetratricopeptide (TPR) repeat protein
LNPDSSLGLYLIPTTQIPPSTLRLWCEADGIYRDVNYAIKNKSPLQKWDNFLISFENLRLIDRSDPLLMSIYWEKVAFFNDLMCDFPGAAEAYQKATQEGYPASHLFFDRGTALKYSGRIEESKKAFKKAEEILKRPGA